MLAVLLSSSVAAFLEWKWHILVAYILLELFYTFFFSTARDIPGPFHSRFSRIPFLYTHLKRRSVHYANHLHRTYGDIVRLGPDFVSVASPEAFNLLLRQLDIPKSPIYERFGINKALSSFSMTNKEQHRQRRRIVSQAFSAKALRSVEPAISEVGITKAFAFIDKRSGSQIDLGDFFHRVTLDVIGRVAFGSSFQFLEETNSLEKMNQIKKAIELDFSQSVIFSIFPFLSNMTFLPATQKRIWSRETLISFAERLRDERIALKSKDKSITCNDILDLILNAADPTTGEKLAPKDVTMETLTFLKAGSETASNTMIWTIYLLLKHPEIMERVQSEIRRVSPNQNEFLTNDMVRDELPLFNATLNESMRLYPVAGDGSLRILDRDVHLGQYKLEKGMQIRFSIYSLHHNPKIWENPKAFDPDRFLPPRTNNQDELKNRFEPFSCGMRNCVGREFAKMEMRLVLTNLLKFYNFKFARKDISVKPILKLTMVPDSPIHVFIQKAF